MSPNSVEQTLIRKIHQLPITLQQQILDFIETLPQSSLTPNYQFGDLAGRLEWRGDAVAQQRQLRDEW